jgi:hypothetical protein
MKKIIDKGLNFLRAHTYLNFLEDNENWLVKIGLWSIYFIIPVLILILGINFELNVGYVLGAMFACLLLGYIADKMLEYVKPTIANAETKIVSGSLLDVLSVVIGLAGVIAFGVSIYFAFKSEDFSIFVAGLFIWWTCEYCLAMLLAPTKTLNVHIAEKASSAETFIGIASLVMKALYRLIPVAFGSLMIWGDIYLIDMLFDSHVYFFQMYEAAYAIGWGVLLPLCAYLTFLAYYFVVDVFVAFFKMAEAVVNKNKAK